MIRTNAGRSNAHSSTEPRTGFPSFAQPAGGVKLGGQKLTVSAVAPSAKKCASRLAFPARSPFSNLSQAPA